MLIAGESGKVFLLCETMIILCAPDIEFAALTKNAGSAVTSGGARAVSS